MTAATLTLTEFLLARIAEDEANIEGKWSTGDGGLHIITVRMHERLLAECEAKRRIVGYRENALHGLDQMQGSMGAVVFETQVSTYDAVLRALALTYADHPDYREGWRP